MKTLLKVLAKSKVHKIYCIFFNPLLNSLQKCDQSMFFFAVVKMWHFSENTVCIHTFTYHSRFIPEKVAEASQIFLRDALVLPRLLSYEEHCRRKGGKPIAVCLQSISP
jgi:hypothetical protein